MWTSRATWPKVSRSSNQVLTLRGVQKSTSRKVNFVVEIKAAIPAVPLSQEHQTFIDQIVALHEQGLTNRAIADHLNANGIRSWTGKSFYPQLVFGLIRKAKLREERGG